MSLVVSPLRVVIADDTSDMRDLLRINLEADGRFEIVGEAADGAEAVDMAASSQPDAIVLDLAMPVMDGLQAIPEIKRRSPGSRIAVLSGFNAHRMAAPALEAGADRYLEKGRAFSDIAAVLLEICLRPNLARPLAPLPPKRATPDPAIDETLEHVSFIAHELMMPLTALKGFSATLTTAIDRMDRATTLASARAIERGADNMAALVRNFADARAVETHSLDLLAAPVDLAGLVIETVADLAPVTEPRSIEVDALPIRVEADAVKIRQILTNLVSNAAKFSPRDSRITVRLAVNEGFAEMDVIDQGTGIAAGGESALFEKFSRLDPTARGTGLGLFISRGIARAHGGDLVFSRLDRGSCFRLRIPVSGATYTD